MLACNSIGEYAIHYMKDLSINKLLQDISAIIGSLLPIIQLFFNQWVFAFDKVFLAKDQFLGISIITLIVSYIFIIAYLSNPFGEFLLPFQKSRQVKMQEYWNERNRLEVYLGAVANTPNVQQSIIKNILKDLSRLKQPKQPITINQQNQGKAVAIIIIVFAVLFLALGISQYSNTITSIFQATSYVLLISFSALMLTIYKKNSDNNTRYQDNRRTRVDRAIKLAIDANGFGKLPQVTFMSQEDTGQYNSNLKIKASYEDKVFEIITDGEAQFLVSVKEVVETPEVPIEQLHS